ncbi:MAG: VWA domain-containing protein [Deltaproteobacteria bacterium]|nr:MAG: VWA domain-containing protein [Deltaproteobacteria bacterium]
MSAERSRFAVWILASILAAGLAGGCAPAIDSDGDFIADVEEGKDQKVDTDGDGVPDFKDDDSDGDGILDSVEAGDQDAKTPAVDTDGDGTPDFQDTDSDGNGVDDGQEGSGDSDGDGVADFRDIDDDSDGILDADEVSAEGDVDTDGDGTVDRLDDDSDGDGLSDRLESGDDDLLTKPVDSDGDGTPDFQDIDSDGNGLGDGIEGSEDSDGDGIPDYRDADDDGDSIPDELELDSGQDADADGDGTPNRLDLDSDGDTISDQMEGLRDTDRDGTADFLDTDSDNDGIPDAIEAGDDDLQTAPIDTDGDGRPDYLDLDSDNDGLPDSMEDLNGNGQVDPGESDPHLSDTDGDGTPDLVEASAGSDPSDPNSNIDPGDFFFVLPYGGPGQSATFDFTTEVRIADVFFSMDTTGSFQEEIDNLKASISQVIDGIRAVVPDTGFGIGAFEDFPVEPFGLVGDMPFELLQRITTDSDAISSGVASLPDAFGGADTPEAGYVAMFRWLTGAGLPAFGIAQFDPQAGYNDQLGHGLIGGVGFRDTALPIVVQITDAVSHDPADYPDSFGLLPGEQRVIDAARAMGARIIGINSLENAGTADEPRAQLESLALATGAAIPPDQATGKCATGVDGAPLDPDPATGTCPLVFDVRPDGSGLGSLIVDAIVNLVTLGKLDISSRAAADQDELQTSGIDTSQFITAITPVPPAPAGATINGDIFMDVTPGSQVTFQVDAFNDIVPETDKIQLFQVDIQVLGDAVTLLDVHKVYVIVPPKASYQ